MKKQEIQQITNIIENFIESKKLIPFLSDLENYPVIGPIISTLEGKDKEIIEKLIDNIITEKISNLKTKWGLLFKRFFENDEDLFWDFRDLNEESKFKTNQKEFQKLWKQVEQEMFKYEWILTDRMLKQEKWLDKVLESFYNIVYCFFPKYGQIE